MVCTTTRSSGGRRNRADEMTHLVHLIGKGLITYLFKNSSFALFFGMAYQHPPHPGYAPQLGHAPQPGYGGPPPPQPGYGAPPPGYGGPPPPQPGTRGAPQPQQQAPAVKSLRPPISPHRLFQSSASVAVGAVVRSCCSGLTIVRRRAGCRCRCRRLWRSAAGAVRRAASTERPAGEHEALNTQYNYYLLIIIKCL